MNTARLALAGTGTQTAALAFGGADGTVNTGATEEYDGTSWTNSSPASLATARNRFRWCRNTNSAALGFGGATDQVIQQQQKNGQVQVLH
jgi:hypothetical protein